jgi:hypothetical protein
LLTGVGFALFAFGLELSTFETRETDFSEMFWPQVIRGVSIMFCLLPPTRLALGALSETEVPDASGLFNLMRNLGGPIGILGSCSHCAAKRNPDGGLEDRQGQPAAGLGRTTAWQCLFNDLVISRII